MAALRKAGLAHSPFDGPAPDQLQAVMKRVDELKGEEAIAFGFREGFAGVAARAAMPKLQETIRREFRPDLVIRELPSLPRWLPRRRQAFRRPASRCIAANTSAGSPHRSPERSTSSALWLRSPTTGIPSAASAFSRRFRRRSTAVRHCPTGLLRVAPEIFALRHAASALQPDWMPDGDKPFLFMTFWHVVAGDR